MLIESNQCQLLLVDVQTRLVPHVQDPQRLAFNNDRLLQATRQLNIPLLATEQYPKGLGHTIPQLREQLKAGEIAPKEHFSAYKNGALKQLIDGRQRRQVVLCGIEAHVCVLQTAESLLQADYQVFVVEDSCSSRNEQDKQVALARLHQAGAVIVSTEMVIFEWIERANTDTFRALLPLIR